MKKPRKRLTQTLAEKVGTCELYVWKEMMGTFEFTPVSSVSARLIPVDGKWKMAVSIKGQRFAGERPTLEEAFKATANLLYKHAKEFWLRMDTRTVTAPWAGVLPKESL